MCCLWASLEGFGDGKGIKVLFWAEIYVITIRSKQKNYGFDIWDNILKLRCLPSGSGEILRVPNMKPNFLSLWNSFRYWLSWYELLWTSSSLFFISDVKKKDCWWNRKFSKKKTKFSLKTYLIPVKIVASRNHILKCVFLTNLFLCL